MNDKENPATELKELSEHLPNAPVVPAHGIAAIALTMAMKYHDINTVQDGALYQQYKLEGKNMVGLHLDHVFETAEKMEAWLIASEKRFAAIVVDMMESVIEEQPTEPTDEPVVEPSSKTE